MRGTSLPTCEDQRRHAVSQVLRATLRRICEIEERLIFTWSMLLIASVIISTLKCTSGDPSGSHTTSTLSHYDKALCFTV